jgi:ActR/RegA family two-component response regulator
MRAAKVASKVKPRSPEPGTILLLSEDTELHHTLRALGRERSLIVIRAAGGASAIEVMQVLRPAAILLDLDLSRDAAWNTADALLAQSNCPLLILLTGQGDQFDLRTAIRAGSIVHKSAGAARLLEVLCESLVLPRELQKERNALQHVLIRWLRPRSWSAAARPTNWEITVENLAR